MNKQNQIFYIVTGSLYRNLEKTDKETIEIEKVFDESDSFTNRKDAFRYYQNYVDVLLESKNIEYENYEQAQKDLTNFYRSGIIEEHPKVKGITYDNDFGKILTISFCTKEATPYVTKKGQVFYNDRRVIHAIGYKAEELYTSIQINLAIESYLYDFYKIIKGKEVEIEKSFLKKWRKTPFLFDEVSSELNTLLDKWFSQTNSDDKEKHSDPKIKEAYKKMVMNLYPQESWNELFDDIKNGLEDYRFYQKEREALDFFTTMDKIKVMATPMFGDFLDTIPKSV